MPLPSSVSPRVRCFLLCIALTVPCRAIDIHSFLMQSKWSADRVAALFEKAQRSSLSNDTLDLYLYQKDYRIARAFLPDTKTDGPFLASIFLDPPAIAGAAAVVSMRFADTCGNRLPQLRYVAPRATQAITKRTIVRFKQGDTVNLKMVFSHAPKPKAPAATPPAAPEKSDRPPVDAAPDSQPAAPVAKEQHREQGAVGFASARSDAGSLALSSQTADNAEPTRMAAQVFGSPRPLQDQYNAQPPSHLNTESLTIPVKTTSFHISHTDTTIFQGNNIFQTANTKVYKDGIAPIHMFDGQ